MENINKLDEMTHHDVICKILQTIADETKDEKAKRIIVDMMDITTMGIVFATVAEIMAIIPEMEFKMNKIVMDMRIKIIHHIIDKKHN